METLIKQLEKALSTSFPGAKIELHQLKPGKRVGGSLTWDRFNGIPQVDRQVQLRDAVDSALNPEARLQISLILTLTPDEAAALSRD